MLLLVSLRAYLSVDPLIARTDGFSSTSAEFAIQCSVDLWVPGSIGLSCGGLVGQLHG